MTTILLGDAIALGEETWTSVSAVVRIVDHGRATVAKGIVTAKAVAQPGDGEIAFADTLTEILVTGADKVSIKTKTLTVSDETGSYEISITRFRAIDREDRADSLKITHHIDDDDYHSLVPDIDGNVAIAIFDAQVNGMGTLVQVDVFALAVEDELSQSTVMITAAVG
jgi:hypothetical protein